MLSHFPTFEKEDRLSSVVTDNLLTMWHMTFLGRKRSSRSWVRKMFYFLCVGENRWHKLFDVTMVVLFLNGSSQTTFWPFDLLPLERHRSDDGSIPMWQCDRKPAWSTPGPWNWSSWMEFSHHSLHHLHLCLSNWDMSTCLLGKIVSWRCFVATAQISKAIHLSSTKQHVFACLRPADNAVFCIPSTSFE